MSQTKKPNLSVLTDPLPVGAYFFIIYLVKMVRFLRGLNSKTPYKPGPKSGGHFAVTRSVVEGLTKIGADFNYNPTKEQDLGEIVYIPGGVRPLKQMIQFKKAGLIKKLYAGPNICVFASDYDFILCSSEIDGVVNHWDGGCQLWAEDCQGLDSRCFPWPVGVDVSFWRPLVDRKPDKTILVFDKHIGPGTDPARIKPYVDYLTRQGYAVNVLTRTDTVGYSAATYLGLLQRSDLMVGFTKYHGESQGIAWSEAWSVNVPTLILQNEETEYQGRRFRTHSAPFLSDATGALFTSFEEFRLKFQAWERGQLVFNPRDWVLQHHSDEASARLLYHYLTGEEI